MQILSNKSVINGFRAIELREIVPEVVNLGERWEYAGSTEQPHQHRHWEIGYATAGGSELHVGKERKLQLRPGSFWSVPAGTIHWLRRGPQSRHYCLVVGLQLPVIATRHSEWNLRDLIREVVVLHEVQQLEPLFSRIVTEGNTPSQYQAAALRLGIDALLLEIVRARMDENGGAASAGMHPAVSRALNALQTRFSESWTLQLNYRGNKRFLIESTIASIFATANTAKISNLPEFITAALANVALFVWIITVTGSITVLDLETTSLSFHS